MSNQAVQEGQEPDMAHSVPACSFCHKNLDLPGNKPNCEPPETTFISIFCGHLFHRTCIEKLLVSDNVMPCKNKNCVENIERKLLKEVHFETIASPDWPSVAKLEATIDGYKLLTKMDHMMIVKLTTDTRQLKEQITIKSSQFESIEKENLKLVDENKKLRTEKEECIGKIKELKLHYSKLESVEKRNLHLVNINKELQIKNDERKKTIKKLKRGQDTQLVDQIKELRTKNKKLQIENDECKDTIRKLKLRELKSENVNKKRVQFVDQNKEFEYDLQNREDNRWNHYTDQEREMMNRTWYEMHQSESHYTIENDFTGRRGNSFLPEREYFPQFFRPRCLFDPFLPPMY